MGRQIRSVPRDWVHPRDEDGEYIPLLDKDYATALEEYEAHPDHYEEAPKPEFYRRSWTAEEATCFQFYESTTEGTPMSPVFETEEEMLAWLDYVDELADDMDEDEAFRTASLRHPPVSNEW